MDTTLAANLLGSAAAGIIARTLTHPLDTAKARMQALGTNYRGPIDVLWRTANTEGLRGLYRGFGAVIVGGTPGTMLYLCTYDIAKGRLSRAIQSSNDGELRHSLGSDFAVHFSSGMIAEAVACVVYVPVDVIKERLQVQHASPAPATAVANYRSSWHALQTISRTEGIPALYKGYGATLLSFGSYAGLFFLFYERFLKETREYLVNNDSSYATKAQSQVPFHWTVICSCTAGAAASFLTSPLDMAKLRLQVQRGQMSANPGTVQLYRGVVDCLIHSYQTWGARGLFRGAGARVLHFAPATTCTMTAYETYVFLVLRRPFVSPFSPASCLTHVGANLEHRCRSMFARILTVEGA